MASGALIAVGAVAASALGYLWWQKRKAAAASPGSSGCKEACLIAAKAMGQVGSNLETYCNTACAALDKLGGIEAAAGTVGGLWQGLTGESDQRGSILENGLVMFSGAKCPAGTAARTGSSSMLSDHRTGSGSTTSCVDAAGNTVGTLTSDGKFNPYTILPVAPPPATVPVPMPGTTATGSLTSKLFGTVSTSSVTVTERPPTQCESCKTEMAKRGLPAFYCSPVC